MPLAGAWCLWTVVILARPRIRRAIGRIPGFDLGPGPSRYRWGIGPDGRPWLTWE